MDYHFIETHIFCSIFGVQFTQIAYTKLPIICDLALVFFTYCSGRVHMTSMNAMEFGCNYIITLTFIGENMHTLYAHFSRLVDCHHLFLCCFSPLSQFPKIPKWNQSHKQCRFNSDWINRCQCTLSAWLQYMVHGNWLLPTRRSNAIFSWTRIRI